MFMYIIKLLCCLEYLQQLVGNSQYGKDHWVVKIKVVLHSSCVSTRTPLYTLEVAQTYDSGPEKQFSLYILIDMKVVAINASEVFL